MFSGKKQLDFQSANSNSDVNFYETVIGWSV